MKKYLLIIGIILCILSGIFTFLKNSYFFEKHTVFLSYSDLFSYYAGVATIIFSMEKGINLLILKVVGITAVSFFFGMMIGKIIIGVILLLQ